MKLITNYAFLIFFFLYYSEAYKEGKKEKPPFAQDNEPVEEKPEIPEDKLCSICKDLLTDAVMIPCCGNSFCDECNFNLKILIKKKRNCSNKKMFLFLFRHSDVSVRIGRTRVSRLQRKGYLARRPHAQQVPPKCSCEL